MELMQLKYFKTVAEMGKISDAAQSLFVSAPALSNSISRLEKELGMALFDRTNNKIQLNRQGQIFLRYVNQIFSNLDCAKTELQQSIMLHGQHVSIACVASTQWVDMITAFSQEHPHFTLSCTNVKRTELAANGLPVQHNFLFAAEEDIPAFYAGELDSLMLFEDHPVVMVHKDHPIASMDSVSLSEVMEQPIFLPMSNYPLYDHLVSLFATADIPFPAGNAYSHLAAQQMVANGLGIAFSSVHTGRIPALPVRYVPIRDAYRPWISRLYWRKGQSFTEDEQIFKSFVENYYQNPTSA